MNVAPQGLHAGLTEPTSAALARARHGHGGGRQVRPSRRADGPGRRHDGAVAAPSAPSPGQSGLARPRPLRAVERPRLGAALCAAASHRLRPAGRGAQALPPIAFQDAGPSRIRRHRRRRDHHRAARPGLCQCGRHGDRREDACRAVQPAGPRDRRPPHLRGGGRRLPHGRHQPRGGLARRQARARQADRALRRQRHLDRRRRGRMVPRRHAQALRGLWLARHPRRRRPQPACGRCGARPRRWPKPSGRRSSAARP